MKLAALAALALMLAACVPAAPAPTQAPTAKPAVAQELRIGLIPATASSPILLPVEDGSFAARGLNVSIQTVTDTAQAMISVASGQLDMGNVTLGSAALNAFNRGTDLKIIGAGAAEPPGHGSNVPVVVRTELIDSGAVKSMADLRGRKIALNGKGVIIEYALMKALATGGLTPNDVDVVTMPFPEMVVALSTGAIDAGMLLQPTAAQAVARGAGKILIDDFNQNAQNAVLVVNTRYLESHRDALAAFLEVYVQNIRKLENGGLRNNEQALAVLQKYTNAPPEVIKLGPDPYWPKDARVLVDSVQDEQRFFMSTAATDYQQPLDINKLIDYGPLDAALKNLGG